MKKFLAFVAGIAVLVTPASAGTLRMWLSADATGQGYTPQIAARPAFVVPPSTPPQPVPPVIPPSPTGSYPAKWTSISPRSFEGDGANNAYGGVGTTNPANTNSFNPDYSAPNGSTQRFYIWGRALTSGDVWNGVAFNIDVDGPGELAAAPTLFNPNIYDVANYDETDENGDPTGNTGQSVQSASRWQGTNAGALSNSNTESNNNNLVSASGPYWGLRQNILSYSQPVGSGLVAQPDALVSGPTTGDYLLGCFDVKVLANSGDITVWLEIGQSGITEDGSAAGQPVQIGFGLNSATPDPTVAGNSFNGRSATFDARITATPEPSTLALLSLGLIGLIRRR